MSRYLPNTQATEAVGARMAGCGAAGDVIFLHGDLGAGKTTLVRGLLRALGHRGAVKSPTYTLVEPYDTPAGPVFHFDLYRLGDPEELEYMGIRDYLDGRGLCLVEWPERGAGILPEPQLDLFLDHADAGRLLRVLPHGERGRELMECLFGT